MTTFLVVLSWSYICCTCAMEAALSGDSHMDHTPNSRLGSIIHQSSPQVDQYQRGTNNLERSHEANQPTFRSRCNNNDNQSSQYLDGMVDILLTGLKETLVKTESKINIPNISENFSLFSLKISFNARDGRFSGLDSLHRSLSSVLQKERNSLQAFSKLTLDDITFGYDHYELKFHNFGPTGRIKIRVQKIDVTLKTKIIILNDTNCQVMLEDAQVTELKYPRIEITGLYPFNSVLSNFATWVTRETSKGILGVVTAQLKFTIQEALQNFKCNKYRVQIFKQIMRNE